MVAGIQAAGDVVNQVNKSLRQEIVTYRKKEKPPKNVDNGGT